MYRSLKKHCSSFHLYIFAFDSVAENLLKDMDLEDTTIVSLKEFEDEELLRVKPTRTKGEYCWTCSGSTILYCIEKYNLDHCTYIDADLYFFSDPSVLIEEMEDKDILITEHRFTKKYDCAKENGKYCVQFVTVKNTDNGLNILRWWRNACIDWCYARMEDGKFGDQKYLDDWTERFNNVHVLQHLGGGVAPWNMQQYTFFSQDGEIKGKETASGKTFNLIFFHFHNFHSYKKGRTRELTPYKYKMPRSVKKLVYNEYVPVLKESFEEIRKKNNAFDSLATVEYKSYWDMFRKTWKRLIKHKNINSFYWKDKQ